MSEDDVPFFVISDNVPRGLLNSNTHKYIGCLSLVNALQLRKLIVNLLAKPWWLRCYIIMLPIRLLLLECRMEVVPKNWVEYHDGFAMPSLFLA